MPYILYKELSSQQSLTDIREKLIRISENLIENLRIQKIIEKNMTSTDKNIAVLDILMIKNAIGNSIAMVRKQHELIVREKKQIPVLEKLDILINKIDSQRKIFTITYADLIFSNPLLTDPRVFLPLDTIEGQENYWFYEAHRRAELSFKRIDQASRIAIHLLEYKEARKVKSAIKVLKKVGLYSRKEFSRQHKNDKKREEKTGRITPALCPITFVEDVIDNISRLHDDMNHYKSFRFYLNSVDSNPRIGGASGQYTASVPGLELLLAGDVLPHERIQYTNGNWLYMSDYEREHITSARQLVHKKLTLDALSYSIEINKIPGSQDLLNLIYGYNDFINEFRRRHKKSVQKQIPEYFQGIRGTGGTTGKSGFLDQRRALELIQRPRPSITNNY